MALFPSRVLILLSLLLIQPLQAQATLLIGRLSANGNFSPMPLEDASFVPAYRAMLKYQWPTPDEQTSLAEGAQPGMLKVEEKYLENQIQKDCRQGGGADCSLLSVKWLPQTLWDLTIIRANLGLHADPKDTQPLKCEIKKETQDVIAKNSDEGQKYFACLQKLVFDQLRSTDNQFFTGVPRFVPLVNKLYTQLRMDAKTKRDTWAIDQFVKQGKDDVALFEAVVNQEILAHDQNGVIVWRATDGVEIKEIDGAHWLVGETSGKRGSCEPSDLFQRWIKPILEMKALDFPLNVEKKEGKVFGSPIFRDQSYAHSILAAYFYAGEGYNSGCPYAYLRPVRGILSSDILYRIILSREQMNFKTLYTSFSTGNIPAWFGVFGSSEYFHPRTGYLKEGDQVELSPLHTGTWLRPHPASSEEQLTKAASLADLLSSDQTQIVELRRRVVISADEEVVQMKSTQKALLSWLGAWKSCWLKEKQ